MDKDNLEIAAYIAVLVTAVFVIVICVILLYNSCRKKQKDKLDHWTEASHNQIRERISEEKIIDYCKSDDENEDFENFCKQFLPNDITVKKIRQRQQSPKLLAMVLIPIVDGRDNLLEYLRKLIEDTISNNHINEDEKIWLVHISHDGNNKDDPIHVMRKELFQDVIRNIKNNIIGVINIVYDVTSSFPDCQTNRDAVKRLKSELVHT